MQINSQMVKQYNSSKRGFRAIEFINRGPSKTARVGIRIIISEICKYCRIYATQFETLRHIHNNNNFCVLCIPAFCFTVSITLEIYDFTNNKQVECCLTMRMLTLMWLHGRLVLFVSIYGREKMDVI